MGENKMTKAAEEPLLSFSETAVTQGTGYRPMTRLIEKRR
jgi:hypothetical protein